jgi:hypothetical protein
MPMLLFSKASQLSFWWWVNNRLEKCYKVILEKKIVPLTPKPPETPSVPLRARQITPDEIMVFYIHPTTGQMVRIGADPKGYDS